MQQAFLHATLSEPLYMRAPPNVPNRDGDGDEIVCRLKKSLYGLKQSPREWSILLTGVLLDFGCTQSIIDTCLFTYNGGKDHDGVCYILVYVDDLILAYSSEAIRDRVVRHLTTRLPIDDLEWALRMKVARDRPNRSITISQTQYLGTVLDKHNAWSALPQRYHSPMDERFDVDASDAPTIGSAEHAAFAEKRSEYMTVVGSLLWLSACTRPDLSYTVSTLARFVGNPGPSHYSAMLRTLAYLNLTRDCTLRLSPKADQPMLAVYSDASWTANNSVSGGAIFYLGCLLAWWTRRQKSVSSSSAQAEYFAAATASREGVYARDLLDDIDRPVTGPTPLLLDSQSAVELTYDPVAFKKTKHILRAANELRDRVARDVFKPEYVPAADQLADILTKPLGPTAHQALMPRLMGTEGATVTNAPHA